MVVGSISPIAVSIILMALVLALSVLSFLYVRKSREVRLLRTSLRKDADADASAAKPNPEESSESDPAREVDVILVIEENQEARDSLVASLSFDYKILSAMDGAQGLEVIRTENPSLVISDVVMPEIQGDELCRILKRDPATSHIPVILLTALCDRDNIINGLESGAADYVTKPYDLSLLKVRIKNILKDRERLRDKMSHIGSSEAKPKFTNRLDKEFMEKVLAVAQAQVANEDFAMDDFCRELGMSRTSFYNKIKALTGHAPNDFFKLYRLNKAKALLEMHQYTVSNVAYMVGFSDPKYFSVCFKKQFGVSPGKI